MDCVRCGGRLPPKSDICEYCGVTNDTDLRAIHEFTKKRPLSERVCPRCDCKLHTLDIGGDGDRFLVERCEHCFGTFFDPNELEAFVDHSIDHVYDVDYKRLGVLIEDHGRLAEEKVAYVKCPECRVLMNRRQYGSRSGVVVDTCKEHGVWLDGGELGAILKWAKAGGAIHQSRKTSAAKAAEERERIKAAGLDDFFESRRTSSVAETEGDLLGEFVAALTRVIRGA